MKHILSCAAALAAVSLIAADSSPKDQVAAAAKALAAKPNYTWTTTVSVPEGARFRPGPTEGKTEKDGVTLLRLSFGDNQTQAVLKGDKAAVTSQDGDWQSLAELENSEGPGRFWARMLRGYATPATQAAELAGHTASLKAEGDAIVGDLTEEGAKSMATFRRRTAGGDGPEIRDAKGSVKFWLKDGQLVKYEFKVRGTMSFNGNDVDLDRTSVIEIKDVGTTKIEVPEAAKAKLS